MKKEKNYIDEWMTTREIKLYTKLSESTIRRYIQRGNLKVLNKTGRILVKRSKVDEWLNG